MCKRCSDRYYEQSCDKIFCNSCKTLDLKKPFLSQLCTSCTEGLSTLKPELCRSCVDYNKNCKKDEMDPNDVCESINLKKIKNLHSMCITFSSYCLITQSPDNNSLGVFIFPKLLELFTMISFEKYISSSSVLTAA